jgi:CheY-like chemotaxis protein
MATILAIDDERHLLELIDIVLRQAGYRVITAGNGRDGLARLAETRCDAVLVDLSMPVMDGRSFVQEVRANLAWRHLPIMVLSGSAPTEVLMPPEGSYDGFLAKPFDIYELTNAVAVLIAQTVEDSAGHAAGDR